MSLPQCCHSKTPNVHPIVVWDFSPHKTLAWKQTCHAVVVLRLKDRLLPRLDAIHCRLQTNPLQCMHLWMCCALCHPLSVNAHRMCHLWRSLATSTNNNVQCIIHATNGKAFLVHCPSLQLPIPHPLLRELIERKALCSFQFLVCFEPFH